MILRHSDNLSRTLQKKDLSAAEGQHVAGLVKATLQSMHSTDQFDLFWKVLTKKAAQLNIDEPVLPRKRRAARRIEIGESPAEFHGNVIDHYRVFYFEALDLIIQCIDDRFNQPGYRMYSALETLLVKGCQQVEHQDELNQVQKLYDKDIKYDNLEVQFQTISQSVKEDLSLVGITDYLKSLSITARSFYSEIVTLVELILVMPATNATSERSFSTLRHVKSYLRTTMTQLRLNNLMILNVHREALDAMDLEEIGNEFISIKDSRKQIFAQFSK